MLSELAARHVTVALSGQGADELLGGYRKHRVASVLRTLGRLPQPVRSLLEGMASGRRSEAVRATRALAARDPAQRLLAMSGLVDDELRSALLTGPLAGADDSAAHAAVSSRLQHPTGDPLLDTLSIDAQLALVDDMLQYFDRTSMAHSLEVRVPFLDHEVVEFCARLPADLKVHGLTTKYLLKHAARGLVPDRIVDKRKLGFFRGASTQWLNRQLSGPGREYLLAPEPRYAEFVDRVSRRGSRPASRGRRRQPRPPLALDPDPRGLAADVSSAGRAGTGTRSGRMSDRLTYAAITAARNEAENLPRIAACLCAQTALPLRWLIVDNGSTDDTAAVAESLARRHDWIRVVRTAGTAHPVRGGAVVRAFHAGLDALDVSPDVVVKLDADVSMAPDYFERLLAAFGSDPKLGMASGAELVEQDGVWTMRHQARASVVWGPARAYRLSCLLDVLPLEERMGWDAIDEFKANVRGWRTGTLHDLEYRHHRLEGERDGARLRFWATEGSAAFFMGYRPSYLVCRSLFRALREPTALAMLTGYVGAAIRREDRLADRSAVEYLRSQQRLRTLWLRSREVRGA